MKENVIMRKCLAFSVRIVNPHKYLSKVKNEYVISKQICKSAKSTKQSGLCIENEDRAERGK